MAVVIFLNFLGVLILFFKRNLDPWFVFSHLFLWGRRGNFSTTAPYIFLGSFYFPPFSEMKAKQV